MTIAIDQPPPPHVKRWTKREYNEIIEYGELRRQHVYLFRGELIVMSPQYHPHAFAITQLNDVLYIAFGVRKGFKVRIQLPFEVPGESMPEPDALVCTDEQNLRDPHPNAALLVIEVADSSLALDREKALEYAAAQIPEYWIVDVNNRRIEVYRNPIQDLTVPLGFRYPPPSFIESGQLLAPLAKPDACIAIAELFH